MKIEEFSTLSFSTWLPLIIMENCYWPTGTTRALGPETWEIWQKSGHATGLSRKTSNLG